MSGTSDFTRLTVALQDIVKALYASQQILSKGLTVNTSLPVYTVAGLPTTAPMGALAYASNARNTGQAAGAGTGALVVGGGTSWIAVWSGVAVTA